MEALGNVATNYDNLEVWYIFQRVCCAVSSGAAICFMEIHGKLTHIHNTNDFFHVSSTKTNAQILCNHSPYIYI